MGQDDQGKFYTEKFYDTITDGSVRSAKVILKLLYDIYKPQSVIDIGCGQGSWLSVAESLGSTTLVGLDGNWVNQDKLLSNNIKFTPINFENSIHINGQYDLCISLEVGEHLSKSRAPSFINTLCKTSDVILFSAAIKFQGGANHINEQWQSYWLALFLENGFNYFDIFRGKIWRNEEVDWWYRQNIFLLVKNDAACLDINVLFSLEKPILDIVHPKNYEAKLGQLMQLLKKTQ